MTVTCDAIRTAILEALDQGCDAASQHDVDVHLRECPSCEAFAREQEQLDVRLSAHLHAPAPSRALRSRLRRQIWRDALRDRDERLPDIVHFAGCGSATAIGAVLLPFDTWTTMVVGITGALIAYVALEMTRSWLEDMDALE